MPTLFSHLAGEDATARARLDRLWQRARIVVGTEGAVNTGAPTRWRTGMRFPGDALIFAGVVGFLVLCCHVSLAHLVAPALPPGPTRGVGVVFALLAGLAALVTWRLAQLRDPPRTVPEALPDPAVDAPLAELHDFATAMSRELRETSRSQERLAHLFFATLLAIGFWGLALFGLGYTRFAELLLASVSLTASFTALNWRPYLLVAWRRRLAQEAEKIADALADEIRHLDGNDRARSVQEWTAVRDALSGHLRPSPRRSALARRARWRWGRGR